MRTKEEILAERDKSATYAHHYEPRNQTYFYSRLVATQDLILEVLLDIRGQNAPAELTQQNPESGNRLCCCNHRYEQHGQWKGSCLVAHCSCKRFDAQAAMGAER